MAEETATGLSLADEDQFKAPRIPRLDHPGKAGAGPVYFYLWTKNLVLIEGLGECSDLGIPIFPITNCLLGEAGSRERVVLPRLCQVSQAVWQETSLAATSLQSVAVLGPCELLPDHVTLCVCRAALTHNGLVLNSLLSLATAMGPLDSRSWACINLLHEQCAQLPAPAPSA